MQLVTIIKKPLITEKSLLLASEGKFTFEVDSGATKNQIRESFQKYFDVTVNSVKTIVVKGHSKRTPGKRNIYRTPDTKKAIITLKKGQKMPHFQEWFSLEEIQKETAQPEKKQAKKK